jgi:hypothetical protein
MLPGFAKDSCWLNRYTLSRQRNDYGRLSVEWSPPHHDWSTLSEPAAPQPHLDSVNEAEPLERNAVITPISKQDSTKSTAHYLARRLHAVFNDLGLRAHIPPDWLQPGSSSLSFRPLRVQEADKLTLAVEDLAYGYKARRRSAGPNQPSLF